VKRNVKQNVKSSVKQSAGSWQEALNDAEEKIRATNRELADWKAVAAICRKRIAAGDPWPENPATRN